MNLSEYSIKVSNFKSFGRSPQGLDSVSPFNILIGKNNVGKSALLDAIQSCFGLPLDLHASARNGASPNVVLSSIITLPDLLRTFKNSNAGGDNVTAIKNEFGNWIDRRIIWKRSHKNGATFQNIEPELRATGLNGTEVSNADQLIGELDRPLRDLRFERLLADRDITTEPDNSPFGKPDDKGKGITRLMGAFHTESKLDHSSLHTDLFNALNAIYNPEVKFRHIYPQKNPNSQWEIFLEEEGKGKIALSQSGSGLKSVIAALCFIHLLPSLEHCKLDQYMFAFEELENNLHPEIQRRLFSYLHRFAVEKHCCMILSTHSNVVIDLFSSDPDSQIINIQHDGIDATCRLVKTYSESRGTLSDLGVRASDILQSNGVIWVEGPSDRNYLIKWISLWSGGNLHDGNHYQCVFYGGKILAHLDGTSPDEDGRGLNIFAVNSNAAMVIDSDRVNTSDPINSTKSRLKSEMQKMSCMCWITDGREIENYLSTRVLAKYCKDDTLDAVDKYEKVFETLRSTHDGEEMKMWAGKVYMSAVIETLIELEDIYGSLDLANKLTELCTAIYKWNGMGDFDPPKVG